MNPGKLDRLAQFYALTEEVGPGAAPRRTFSNPVAILVSVEKDRFGNRLPADQAGGAREAVEARFMARYSDAITSGSRLRVDGVTYEIKGVAEAAGPRRAYMVLTCRSTAGTKPVAA